MAGMVLALHGRQPQRFFCGLLVVFALLAGGSAFAQAQLSRSATSLAFGGQSMATRSPGQALTLTNTGNATLTISAITSSNPQFVVIGTCGSIPPGGGCAVQVAFEPAIAAGGLNSSVAVAGTLSIASNAAGSPHTVALSGTAEKSLVTQYFRAILGRDPDAPGKTFWSGEADRVAGTLGANVNETWYAMAIQFFFSPEYLGRNRDNLGFLADLYGTFFNRAPDPTGQAFWLNQLQAGAPREVVLANFLFSAEFNQFTQSIFGSTAVRPEIDTVVDFYRGLLGRIPDNGGFAFWLQQFRTAQCAGSGAQVQAQADAISSQFLTSPEYVNRNRSNGQFVADLYNAFLRRGADFAGANFWVTQLATGAMTREQMRQAFVASPEFQARVQAVIVAGCFTPPTGAGQLRVSVGGFGYVASAPAGISCGTVPAALNATSTKCVQNNTTGTVTLTATPFSSAFQFAGWAGDTSCTTNPSCAVDMSVSRWVRAKFVPVQANGNVCQALGLVSDKANHPLNGNFPALTLGQAFTDPNFGTTIRKISNVTGDGRGANKTLVPAYSTISAWNADESYLILYRTDGPGGGHELFNGKTYAFIRKLDDLPYADIEQFYWDTTRPNILYGVSAKTLYKYDVDAAGGSRLTALRNFSTQCGTASPAGGTDPFFNSWDSKIFGIACGNSGPMFSYNAATNALGTVAPAGTPRANPGDGPQAAPSGTKLFLNVPNAPGNRMRVFDLNMVAGAFLDQASGEEHAGSNRLFNGDDTLNAVHFDPGPSGTAEGAIVQWNMNGTPNAQNRIVGRVIVGPSTGWPYPPGGHHISGTSFNRTGLLASSIIGAATGATTLDGELLFVDSDAATNPGNFACRVGHHRSTSNAYFSEPHAVISPSGTRILFGSSWGDAAALPVTNSYVVELPGYKP